MSPDSPRAIRERASQAAQVDPQARPPGDLELASDETADIAKAVLHELGSGAAGTDLPPVSRRSIFVALALMLLLAAALRGIGLLSLPHLTDETGEVLWAWDIAFAGARPLTHTDAYNGAFWPYLLAAAFRVFGSSAALPRIFAMGLSLATVAASFGLGWLLGPSEGRRRLGAATLAGFLMATAFTPILVNGRVAWSNSSTPLWTSLTLILLLRAAAAAREDLTAGTSDPSAADPSARWLMAAGVMAGLALQTHPSVLVLLAGAAIWWLLAPERRSMLRGPWPWAAVGLSLLAYGPVIFFNLRDGFRTLSEASDSVNWAPGDVAPGPAGSLAAVAQLGRSVLGGFDLNGPTRDPVWTALSWLWAILLLAGMVRLARSRAELVPAAGRRLPLVVVGLALIGLPAFNRNWQGFLEARYLGYTLPLLFAAVGSVIAARWEFRTRDRESGAGRTALRGRPRRLGTAVAGFLIILLILLPALRVIAWQRDAYREQFDNRRLWSMLAEAELAAGAGAEVYVDRELKPVVWRAGGQPRRAVEYLLTLEGIDYVQAPAEKINHKLGEGADLVMFLAGDTASKLREWGHALEEIDVAARPGEGDWGLYRSFDGGSDASAAAGSLAELGPNPESAATLVVVSGTPNVASGAPTPTPPRRAGATGSPNAMATLLHAPTAAHIPQAISLADAEATVMAMAIPEVDRRIETSFLTTQTDLRVAFGEELPRLANRRTIWLSPMLEDAWPTPESPFRASLEGPGLIFVLGSDARFGFDELYDSLSLATKLGFSGGTDARISNSEPAERGRFAALFEADDGEYVGATGDWYGADYFATIEAEMGSLPGIESARVQIVTQPPPEPTPTPYLRSSALATSRIQGEHPPTPLAIGEVPEVLMGAALELPLVRGARWRYQVTGRSNTFHWNRSVCEIEVAAVERIADDLVRAWLQSSDSSSCGLLLEDAANLSWHLLPGMAVGSAGYRRDGISTELLRGMMRQAQRGTGVESDSNGSGLYDILPLPVPGDAEINYVWQTEGRASADVPAGPFEDCAILDRIFSARVIASFWFCPGVGIARVETPFLGSSESNSIWLQELIDYEIPKLRPIP
jgi:hypothetical protein